MKAIVQDRYGSPDVLELREIDRPVNGDDQVLVRVHTWIEPPALRAGTAGRRVDDRKDEDRRSRCGDEQAFHLSPPLSRSTRHIAPGRRRIPAGPPGVPQPLLDFSTRPSRTCSASSGRVQRQFGLLVVEVPGDAAADVEERLTRYFEKHRSSGLSEPVGADHRISAEQPATSWPPIRATRMRCRAASTRRV